MITPTIHTLRRASLTAGVGLALMAVLAGFAVFGAIAAQITPGDAERTRRTSPRRRACSVSASPV